MKKSLPALIAIALMSACSVNVATTGPSQHESRSVDKDASTSLTTNIKMGAGSVKMSGGSQKWMDADFTYNVPSWKPDVRYTASGGRGDLTVEQPGSSESHVGKTTNEWDIRLNNDVSTDLKINLGAGETHLDLGSVKLHSLNVEMGAGELRLDLRGTPKQSYDVRIRGGAGEATVYVPAGAGIVAHAKGGLGDINVKGLRKDGDRWVNESGATSKVQITLDIEGGVGSINIIADASSPTA